jgi:O-antigen ligase
MFKIPNLITALFISGIICGPFVVNYSLLPEGWELPKVFFWQVLSLIVILLAITHWLTSSPTIIIKRNLLYISLTGIVVALSSLVTFYPRSLSTVTNPLFLQLTYLPEINISLWGNQFRDQGLFTMIPILLALYIFSRSLTTKSRKFVLLSFSISACLQSLIAVGQFVSLFSFDPYLATEGRFIFGTFGQTNFYAGHLLVGLVCAVHLLKTTGKWKIFALVSAPLILLGLTISFSYWAYVVAVLLILLMVSYDVMELSQFKRRAKTSLLLMTLVIVPVAIVFLTLFPEYNFRVQIWQEIINVNLEALKQNPVNGLFHILFGWGYDTMAEVFAQFGKFTGSLVDRAHNFFFDVFTSNGLLGLGLLIAFLGRQINTLIQKLDQRELAFILFAIIAWLVRSFIHESSIINLLDFGILVALAYSFRSTTEHKAE